MTRKEDTIQRGYGGESRKKSTLRWKDFNEISSMIAGLEAIHSALDDWRCFVGLEKPLHDSLYVQCYALGAAVKELSHKIEEMEKEGHCESEIHS